MRTILTLPKFAKELGFSRANEKGFHEHLRYLLKVKAIEVQQGGFLGDSMHHPKLVVIRDFKALEMHFSKLSIGSDTQKRPSEKEKRLDLHAEKQAAQHAEKEKFWGRDVEYCRVGQFSRTFYMELGPETIRQHHLKKGDIVKYILLELRRAPEENEPLRDPGEL